MPIITSKFTTKKPNIPYCCKICHVCIYHKSHKAAAKLSTVNGGKLTFITRERGGEKEREREGERERQADRQRQRQNFIGLHKQLHCYNKITKTSHWQATRKDIRPSIWFLLKSTQDTVASPALDHVPHSLCNAICYP